MYSVAYPVPHARTSERRVARLPPGRTYLLEVNGDFLEKQTEFLASMQLGGRKPLEPGTGTHGAESISAQRQAGLR